MTDRPHPSGSQLVQWMPQSGADDLGQTRRAQRARQGARGAAAGGASACGFARTGCARRRARPFVAARRQPGLEQAADAARQRRTLERKIKRMDKRIAAATRTFNDLRGRPGTRPARSCSVPTKSPDETRFIRDVGAPGPRGAAAVPDPGPPTGRRAPEPRPRPHHRPRPHPRPDRSDRPHDRRRSEPRLILPLAGLAIVLALGDRHPAGRRRLPLSGDFGGGLFDVGRVRLYAPWSFVGWYVRYARSYQQAFDLAALIAPRRRRCCR